MILFRFLSITCLVGLLAAAQPARRVRTPPPTRDPHTPGYVDGEGVAGRRECSGECGREFHPWPDA